MIGVRAGVDKLTETVDIVGDRVIPACLCVVVIVVVLNPSQSPRL